MGEGDDMGLFDKKVKYEDMVEVAKDKVAKVAYYNETITRIALLQYIYSYYSSKRGQVDFHDAMDIVESMYIAGDVKA